MKIRSLTASDRAGWLQMRSALWPTSQNDHEREADAFFAGTSNDPLEVLVAEDDAGRLVGFAELSIRNHAEACRSHRIAYLEGWYVAPGSRRSGVGRALVAAAEVWGRKQGCREFASDADAENAVGIAAHRSVGFRDTASLVCFRKDL